MLRFLLLFQILYTVYQGHYAVETGIPGLNLPNLLFGAVLLILLFSGNKQESADPPALRRPMLFFFFALVFAFIVAQLRAPADFMADLTYLKNAIFSLLLYFMYLRCGQDLKSTRLLIIAVMAVAALAAIQAIRQGLDYGIGTFVESHRASGPFGPDYKDANRAGVFYAMFLPMFISIALFFRKQIVYRIAALVGIGLMTTALLMTYSRQAYFIALLGITLLFLRRSLVLSVAVAIVVLSTASLLPDSFGERVAETQQKGPHGEEVLDESTVSRWEIWHGAFDMWLANPAGVGLNRFKSEIGNYSNFHHFDAHNFYVLTLAECGPLGLAALLTLIAALLRFGLRLRRAAPLDDAEARALTLGFIMTTLCMALGNLYGSPFLEGNVMGSYWILCGLLERYMHLKAVPTTAVVAAEPSPAERMRERFPLAARTLPGRRT